MSTSSIRSRWAAVGAAVAVCLGAGGVGITHATISSGERAVFVPLDDPCRLADLRPAPDTVGPRPTPLGADESYTLDGWGAEGDCNLPSGTTGLALNVTAVNATQQTNLRFFPADTALPGTANLNPTPGAPPTPNAVNVNLDGSGQFKVFNKFGSVSVIIDVMGYYEHHDHDDRYYTKDEVNALADEPSSPGGIPDAVGLVDSTGALNSGTSNISSTTWNAGLGRYEITFSDFGFWFTQDVALVTPAGTSADITATTSSVGGTTLLVILKNGAGANVQSDFSFAVWNLDT